MISSGINAERLLASVRRILQIMIIKHSALPKNARGIQGFFMGDIAKGNVIAKDHNVLS
jgi:hypothetical protein